ncbi:MAG: sugar phosphate isomerase/epimerase [Chloroflexota bacterium]|nr:sugar phosphate isomerase/epimerase [Chloroflexota bacterium]
MQFAFSTLACPSWDWQQVIRAANDYGYDGIEWRLINGDVVTREFSLDTAQTIAQAVADAGLGVCALDSSVRLVMPRGPERDAQIKEARGMLRVARALGADILRVFPGKYAEDVSDEDAIQWVVEGLESLIPTARQLGVKVVLETHDKFDWPRMATRGTTISSFLRQVLLQVQAPEVGLQWDIGNPYVEGESPETTFENVKGNLTYVHLKDMRQTSDGTWEYVAMGEGDLPIRDAIDWLADSGFTGWLSFEWEKAWHPELAEPEVALPQFITYMRSVQNAGTSAD